MSTAFPLLSPFSFRCHCRDEDIPAILAVHEACRERDATDPDSVCYSVPNLTPTGYARLLQDTPPEGILIAEEAGKVVAHAWMEVWGVEERMYLWQVWVVPRWRGHGLGTAMNRWGETKAREMYGDDARVGLHLANATDGERDAVTLLLSEGHHLSFVSPELAFDAFESLATVPTVRGIALRALKSSEHRAVARALSEANLNPPDHEDRWIGAALESRIDTEEAEWLGRIQSADPELSPVAWEGGEIAGAYLCRRSGRVGEIAQVAVRAPWRGRGVARALAMQSLHGLRAAGCVSARLFTSIGPEEEEPVRGPYVMYRKFGFSPIARHLRYRKAMRLEPPVGKVSVT